VILLEAESWSKALKPVAKSLGGEPPFQGILRCKVDVVQCMRSKYAACRCLMSHVVYTCFLFILDQNMSRCTVVAVIILSELWLQLPLSPPRGLHPRSLTVADNSRPSLHPLRTRVLMSLGDHGRTSAQHATMLWILLARSEQGHSTV